MVAIARLAILPAALLLCGFVSITRFEHPPTGHAVTPPAGFVVVDLAGIYSTQAAFAVGVFRDTTTDIRNPPPPNCVVTLDQRSDNAALTQDELNARVRDRATIDPMVEHYGRKFEMSDEPITLADVPGHQFTMRTPDGDATSLVHVVSLFDAPSGRTTLSCTTRAENLPTDLDTIRRIRDGITLP